MSACLLQLSRTAESAAPAEAEAAPGRCRPVACVLKRVRAAEAVEAAPKGPSAISAILGDDY